MFLVTAGPGNAGCDRPRRKAVRKSWLGHWGRNAIVLGFWSEKGVDCIWGKMAAELQAFWRSLGVPAAGCKIDRYCIGKDK